MHGGLRLVCAALGLAALWLLISPHVRAQVSTAPAAPPPPPGLSPSGHPPAPGAAGGLVVPGRVTDLDPQASRCDKGSIIIRHADGGYESYLLTAQYAAAFVRNLPPGDTWVNTLPPPCASSGPPPAPPAAERSALAKPAPRSATLNAGSHRRRYPPSQQYTGYTPPLPVGPPISAAALAQEGARFSELRPSKGVISATQAITAALQMIVEPSRLPGAYIASDRFGRISSSEVPILQGQVWIVVFAGANFYPAPCPPPLPTGTSKPCPTPVPERPKHVAVDARTGKVLVAWG